MARVRGVSDQFSGPDSGPLTGVPLALRVAALIVLVQGVLTVVLGVVEALNTKGDRVVMGSTTALFFVVYGVALGVCAWGLSRRHSWARGPVLLAELMWLGLAWNFRTSDLTWLAVLGAVSAVVALVCLVHPTSTEALERGR